MAEKKKSIQASEEALKYFTTTIHNLRQQIGRVKTEDAVKAIVVALDKIAEEN